MAKRPDSGPRPSSRRPWATSKIALDRLIEGKATHPDYAGRPVRITPAAVAKEARRSRNPLYTTHRVLLVNIDAAASGPTPAADLAATVARLEAKNAELRRIIHQLRIDKCNLATENLSLLHRARLAEGRLRARDRELAALKRTSGGYVFGGREKRDMSLS